MNFTFGILMLIFAIVLDAFGLLCFIISLMGFVEIGEFLSLIPDVVGFIVFGIWMWIWVSGESQTLSWKTIRSKRKEALGIKKKMSKLKSKRLKRRFFFSFLGELLPTGFLFIWTSFVWSVIKSRNQ